MSGDGKDVAGKRCLRLGIVEMNNRAVILDKINLFDTRYVVYG